MELFDELMGEYFPVYERGGIDAVRELKVPSSPDGEMTLGVCAAIGVFHRSFLAVAEQRAGEVNEQFRNEVWETYRMCVSGVLD